MQLESLPTKVKKFDVSYLLIKIIIYIKGFLYFIVSSPSPMRSFHSFAPGEFSAEKGRKQIS